MIRILWLALVAATALAAAPAQAQDVQNLTALEALAEEFAVRQAAGLRGEARVSVGKLDPRLRLAACPAPVASLPVGARAWGRSQVIVQCHAPTWRVYVPVEVRVSMPAVVVARALQAGQRVAQDDLAIEVREVTRSGSAVLTELADAAEMVAARNVPAGEILHQNMLRPRQVVGAGDTVRVRYAGPGFVVQSEGRALGSGFSGQMVQVRIASGKVVTGTARAGGLVELR